MQVYKFWFTKGMFGSVLQLLVVVLIDWDNYEISFTGFMMDGLVSCVNYILKNHDNTVMEIVQWNEVH